MIAPAISSEEAGRSGCATIPGSKPAAGTEAQPLFGSLFLAGALAFFLLCLP